MSKDLSPGENRVIKIDDAGRDMIFALADRKDTESIDIGAWLGYVDDACTDEKVALLIRRLKDNTSKIIDIARINSNPYALDSVSYQKLYGSNMTFDVREKKRMEFMEENSKYRRILASMGKSEKAESKRAPYLNIRALRKDKEGNENLENPYVDLRKYTNDQIMSDMTARVLHKAIMNQDEALEVFKRNPVIAEAVTKVIMAMSIDDLGELVSNAEEAISTGAEVSWIYDVIEDVALLNDKEEFLITPMPKDTFVEILKEMDKAYERELDAKEEANASVSDEANVSVSDAEEDAYNELNQ